MLDCWAAAEAGAPEGAVVVTDEQTAGHGRFGRPWHAPANTSVLVSMVFRPALADLPALPMLLAVATADAIEDVTGTPVQLKWPNDVLINGKKTAGILVESRVLAGTAVAVGGVGINGNFLPGDVAGIPPTATTLMQATGQHISREHLLATLLVELDERMRALRQGKRPLEDWRARLVTLGRTIEVVSGGRVLRGVAEAVDENGCLLLRRPDGAVEVLAAGEVTLQR